MNKKNKKGIKSTLIESPIKPISIKHELTLYPTELQICKPKIIRKWNWRHFKYITFVVHRKSENELEFYVKK